jgi:hypothetical protein
MIVPKATLRRLARHQLLLLAVLAVTAPSARAAAPPLQDSVDPAITRRSASSLDDLLVARAGQDLSVAGLTTSLLEAGPAETARFLRSFEATALRAQRYGTPLDHLARLGGRIREVPAKVASVIGRPEIPDRARMDAIGVSLEILRRDPTDRTLATLVALLERGHPIAGSGAAGLRPGVIAVVSGLTTAEVGTDAQFERLYSAAAPWLCVSIVDGIAASAVPDVALQRLASLLGRIPSVDGAVLNRIHVVASGGPAYADRRTRERIGDYLTDERAFARHESAAALGAIGDRGCVRSLIWLLEDPAPSVREAAHEALKSLTSMTIAGDPVRWRLWLSRQEQWWDAEGEALVARIPLAGRAELVEVLRATCTQRLYQREIAPQLIELVERREVEWIEIGLSALGTLRALGATAAPRGPGLTGLPSAESLPPAGAGRSHCGMTQKQHPSTAMAGGRTRADVLKAHPQPCRSPPGRVCPIHRPWSVPTSVARSSSSPGSSSG